MYSETLHGESFVRNLRNLVPRYDDTIIDTGDGDVSGAWSFTTSVTPRRIPGDLSGGRLTGESRPSAASAAGTTPTV